MLCGYWRRHPDPDARRRWTVALPHGSRVEVGDTLLAVRRDGKEALVSVKKKLEQPGRAGAVLTEVAPRYAKHRVPFALRLLHERGCVSVVLDRD